VTRLILHGPVLGSGGRRMRRSNRSRPMHGDVTASDFWLAAGWPGRCPSWALVLSQGCNADE
jgi:hypothetical protein